MCWELRRFKELAGACPNALGASGHFGGPLRARVGEGAGGEECREATIVIVVVVALYVQ